MLPFTAWAKDEEQLRMYSVKKNRSYTSIALDAFITCVGVITFFNMVGCLWGTSWDWRNSWCHTRWQRESYGAFFYDGSWQVIMELIPHAESIVCQLVNMFPALCKNQFYYHVLRTRHWGFSWNTCILFTPSVEDSFRHGSATEP